ncbi:MAG: hypothetical protein ACREA0_06795 [bacterium]
MPLPPGYEMRLEQRLRLWMKMHDVQPPPEAEMRCLLELALEVSERSPASGPLTAGLVAAVVGPAYFWADGPFHPYFRRYVETCLAGGRPTLGIDLTPGAPAAAEQMPPELIGKLKEFLHSMT